MLKKIFENENNLNIYSHINKKMLTLKDLKEIAKSRGLKGYYKLRKNQLIDLINSKPIFIINPKPKIINYAVESEIEEESANIIETEQTIVLQPTIVDLNSRTPTISQPTIFESQLKKEYRGAGFLTKVKSTVNSYKNWLVDKIPTPIRQQVVQKTNELRSNVVDLYKKFLPKKEENKNSVKVITHDLKETQSALKGVTKKYTIDGGHSGIDAKSFMFDIKQKVTNLLSKNRQTKVNIVLTCEMEKIDIKSGEVTVSNIPFATKAEVILESTDINDLYESAIERILELIANFQMQGSNWRFKSVNKLDINFFVYKPLSASSYIKLPEELASKKAIINMKNKDDNKCFKWCITRALNPIHSSKNPERITKELKEQSKLLNWENIEFPCSLKSIDKFEKINKNICVNVYGYEKKSVYPLRISNKESCEYNIDLLLISDDTTNHYCLIKSMSRLLTSQVSHKKVARLFCRRCLNSFDNENSLLKHKNYCNNHEAVRPELPAKGTMLSFKNYNRSMRVPFVVYADFESFIKPIDTCQPNPAESYTKQYQKHTPSSFCYYIKCFDDKIYTQDPVTYTSDSENDDVAQMFFDTLENNIKNIYTTFKFPAKMIFNEADRKNFNESKVCHICEKELGDDKVRDHCHLSGLFRGAAHNSCNLNYKIPKFFPVVFHNLSGYDSHLFIKKLAGGKINCIPNNEEKYISFSREIVVDKFVKEGKEYEVKRELRFLDSFRFMSSSLDALAKNLSKDQCKNIGVRYTGKKLDLLLKKGVYPYDWVDSIEKLDCPNLPSMDKFYSKLNDSGISDDDYEHAQIVWKEFGCNTFRDYHNLYNVSDVLLLADIFENFRDVCIKNYKLDPAWYYTSPGLAWDAALKITDVKLELLSDYDMILMIKSGIRGGISMISNRHGTANNKYMESFDKNKESSFITYLDANNLYGWAMNKRLPTHGFKWMTDKKLQNWRNYSCILEVDLEYSNELHDLHNDYPLAPESITVNKVEKLIPNLNNKQNYVVHYENLKLYESLGMKITKIHKGIVFEESDWLKKYIDLNTELRTMATNDFEKDFFKLMNNSVFGKCMENIENRVNIRLVTEDIEAVKLASRPNYESRTIFDENLIAIHMKKTKLIYNKPIYLGMCILDLSKTLMYDFHYNYIKKKYGDNAKLLFTDTDSLAYEIKTDDFYKDIASDIKDRFDTSDYPKDHFLYSTENKKVIGKFKDEAAGKQIAEFVGLRAKLYSYKMYEGNEHKKCKGVKKNVVKKSISHKDYKDCLDNKKEHMRKMNVIRSHLHEIYTEEVNKVALSADDDKRVIKDDGIHTYAYGHYFLKSL